jgi:hypothetical protein
MKTDLMYAVGAVVLVVAAGAYLRWAVTSVLAAYRIGRIIGRADARKTSAR